MPLLQFRCEQEHVTEKLVMQHRVASYPHTVTCNECGHDATRILAAPAPPQFKGSGFYATDYKGK